MEISQFEIWICKYITELSTITSLQQNLCDQFSVSYLLVSYFFHKHLWLFVNGLTLPPFSQNPLSATLCLFFTRLVLHACSYSIHVANIQNPIQEEKYVICIVVFLFSTRLVLPAWVTRWGKDESSLRFRVTSLPQVPTTSDSWNLKNLRIANTFFTCLSKNPKSSGLGNIPHIYHFWYATTLFRPVKNTPKSA